MTADAPTPAPPAGRWTDSWTITRRDARPLGAPARRRSLVGLLFPVMIVLMFGYLFGGAMPCPAAATTGSS